MKYPIQCNPKPNVFGQAIPRQLLGAQAFFSAIVPSPRTACLALFLAGFALATGAQAASATKAATGTDLTLAASWSGGSGPGFPTSADIATWSSGSLGGALTMASPMSWGSIAITAATADPSISGAGTLTLGTSGIDMSSSANNLTIANAIALGASQSWTVNSAKTLTVSGGISGLTFGITKAGAGTLTLSGNNTFTGATALSAGTLQLQNSTSLPSVGVTMSSGTTLQLRANSSATFLPSSFGESGNGTFTFDVNNNGSGTGQTLILANLGQFGAASTTPTFNLTGGNNYTLQLGSGSSGSGLLSVYNPTTLNSSTAGVTLSIPGGISINFNLSYTLSLGGAGNLSLGPLVNNQTSGGQKNLTPTFGGSGTITLKGANNFGAAAGTVSSTGTLALNNNGALTGLSTLALNSAVTLDNTSGGAVTISATPTQTWGSDFTFGSASTTGPLNLGTGAVTLGATRKVTVASANYGLTVGGIIGGTSLGITKAGAGTLTLSGVNTYSGATTVNNGRLVGVTGSSSGNSAVTVQSSGSGNTAALGVLYTGANAQWTCSSLTTSAGVSGGNGPVLEFAFNSTPSTTIAPLNVTGNATFTATPTVRVDLGNLSGLSGTIPLMTVGGTAPALPSLVIVGGYSGSTLAWVGNTLKLTLAGSSTPIKWATSPSGTWDINNTGNTVWKNAAGTATYYQEPLGPYGDQVMFDDTYINAGTAITLNSVVNPTSVSANNSTYSYTISGSGAISGAASLTKSGTATLTLGNANTYSGGTTVSAGTLKVGVPNAIPGNTVAGDVSVSGTLDLNTYSDSINGLNGSGTVDTVAGGTPALTVGANGDSGSFGGVIQNTAGTLSLTKAGGGTQTLSGSSSYGGATAISAGTLQYTGSGGNSGGGSYTVSGGGILTINTSGQVQGSTLAFSGNTANTAVNLQSGTLTLSGGSTAVTSGGANNALKFNGGTLKSASGAITIGGSLQILILAGGGTVDTTGGNITSSSGFGYGASTGTGTFTIQGGNTLTAPFTSGSSWTGPLALSGPNTKFVQSAATSLSGVLNIGTGATFDLNNLTASFGGLTGAGTIVNTGGATSAKTLTITGTGGNNFSGSINPVSGNAAFTAVTINLTSGVQTLSGANTYSGVTTVSAGTLQLQNASAIQSSALKYASGSTLNLFSDSSATFLNSGVAVSANASPFTWSIGVNNITGGHTGNTLILPNVSTIMGVNAFSGTTLNVSGGNGYTLQMGANAAGTSAIIFYNSITLNSATAGVTLSIPGGLACGYSPSTFTTVLTGAGNIAIGPIVTTGTTTLPATFGGSGTITLKGANNFGAAAGTVSSTGTLALNNNGALTGLSTLALNSAVTLDNTSGGTVTISATPAQNWNSDFTFGSANTTGALNLGTGAVTPNASRQVTVYGNTLTVGGAIGGGAINLTKAGVGTLVLSGVSTYSGSTTISAGTLTMSGAGQLGSGNYAGNIANSGTLIYNSSAAQTLSGQISGGGALTQQGAGALTLAPASGNNSYGGSTTVNGGKLVVQSSQTGTGNFTVADGADLTVTVSGTSQLQPATLTLGNTTGATLEFNGVNSTTVAPISATSIISGGTQAITVNSGTFAANGTYPLLTWTSGSAPATSLNAVSLLAIGVVGHLVTITSPNAINLVIDSVSDIWTGVSSGNWDTTATGNWTGHATIYSDGDTVLFDDTATGTPNVTVNQVVQPGGVVVNDSAKNYTITSSSGKFIGGSTSLIKAGSGMLTLAGGVNTNTGATTINGGTVSVSTLADGGSASDLGSSANSAANLTLNGGTLQYTGAGASSDRLFALGTSGATLDASGTGALNLSNAGSAGLSGSGARSLTLTGTNTAANALAAVIGDNGGATSLGKSGAGNWNLSGANTYSGATTISAGTLALAGSGTLGNGSSVLTVSGGILDLGGLTSPTAGAVTVSGGTITNGTLTGSSYAGQSGTVSAILAGSGVALTKTTAGTLTLSGANTYSGVTTVSAGTLQLQNPSAIASSALQYASGSTLNLRSDANATFLTTGVTAAANNNPFVWNLDVNNINAGNINNTLILQNVGQLMGAYAFTMSTLNVSGGNGYTLQMGGGATGTGAMNFWNNITLNSTTTGVTLSMPGGLSVNAGFSYSLTLGGAGNISLGSLTRFPGNNLTPTFGGSGIIALNGANNFGAAAGTVSTSGTLALNNAAALTGLSSLTISGAAIIDNISGSTFTLSGNPAQTWSSDFTFGTANTTGALNLGAGTVTLSATRQVTVANATYGLTVGGVISGSTYGLTKKGSGTLTLSGQNTYSGATILSAGTILVNNTSGSGTGSGSVTVSGGTLGGSGIISGTVTVQSGGTLAPGTASIGTLTLGSTLSLAGTANFRVNKSGSTLTSDQVAGATAITAGGILNVTLNSGSDALTDGNSFTLFNDTPGSAFTTVNLPNPGVPYNWNSANNNQTITLNLWPTAGTATYHHNRGIPQQFTVADLLSNVTGATSGKTITLSSLAGYADLTTAQTLTSGATLQASGPLSSGSTIIFYTPAATDNGDSLTYAVSDGRGGSPQGTVSLIDDTGTIFGQQSPQMTADGNGQVTIKFYGVPGYSYYVQRADDVNFTQNVTELGLYDAATNNPVISISDAIGANNQAYYRMEWRP